MLRIIMTPVKLLINAVVLMACFWFFLLVYIVALLGELTAGKPKLIVH